jgi:hypothetical protein
MIAPIPRFYSPEYQAFDSVDYRGLIWDESPDQKIEGLNQAVDRLPLEKIKRAVLVSLGFVGTLFFSSKEEKLKFAFALFCMDRLTRVEEDALEPFEGNFDYYHKIHDVPLMIATEHLEIIRQYFDETEIPSSGFILKATQIHHYHIAKQEGHYFLTDREPAETDTTEEVERIGKIWLEDLLVALVTEENESLKRITARSALFALKELTRLPFHSTLAAQRKP